MIELSKTSDSSAFKMPRRTLKGEEKWKDIEDLINRWARRNPRGAIDNERWIKEAMAEGKGTANTSKNALGRLGLSIHPELMQYIEAFYPDFMSTKDEMHEFMRRFPKFRIPEKV